MALERRNRMKFWRILFVLLLAGCAAPTATPASAYFPLAKGTTWTYSYRPYQPAADPNQIVSAEYRLTETVTKVTTTAGVTVAHVQSTLSPVQVPAEFPALTLPAEFWYVVRGTQVFQSNTPLDPAAVDPSQLILAFDLPLSMNRSWCAQQADPKAPTGTSVPGCENGGKTSVLQAAATRVPAGNFESCYQLQTFYNDGSFFQWFCTGVGVVSVQYDHNGTRFGFQQELTRFTPGTH